MALKRIITLFAFLASIPLCLQAQEAPCILNHGQGKQLFVDGKPFIMYAGELHNSTTGSVHAMADVWGRMADMHLNTVIAPVTWELFEPQEGYFDYTLIDSMIQGCRSNNLKLIVLWFATWKNGASMYAPAWVKTDTERFPRSLYKDGRKMNNLSAFGMHTMEADANAFAHLMRHIREVDEGTHTVIMMQIENEIGTLDIDKGNKDWKGNRAMRDFSQYAENAFNSEVPHELLSYIRKNSKNIHPALLSAWKSAGSRNKGTWSEVFGESINGISDDWQSTYPYYTDELFSAWYHAKYVNYVAEMGKKEYDIPMYVNAWLKQSHGREPGLYPSGAALPHVFDIWRCAAPSIDFYAPDIYAMEIFDWVLDTFSSQGNPIFIPEIKFSTENAARAFYAIGKYGVQCYAPFGIDGGGLVNTANPNNRSFEKAYSILRHLDHYIKEYTGTENMAGLFCDINRPEEYVTMGRYDIGIREFSAAKAAELLGIENENQKSKAGFMGLLVFKLAEGDFLVAGGFGDGTIIIRQSETNNAENVGILSVDEVTYDDEGHELYHRLNGDETTFGGASIRGGAVKVFRIKVYDY